MRLISLHVENFGVLHDCNEAFDAGLNVRLCPNSWGKSTLAVFIKAMLYGLPASTRRSLIENERKRYTPWQGGMFGGSLDVELSGEIYRIERSFGAKESDDTLSVLCLRTGQQVQESWAASPGLSLFGVDASAYERSTYFSQRPDEQTKDGTVGIHAKLNRLVDATDDIANYDSAMAALDKRRQYYRLLKGEGGVIFQNQQRLSATERAIELSLSQKRSLTECRARMEEIGHTIRDTRRSLAKLDQAEQKLHRQGEMQAVLSRMSALRAEITELQQGLDTLRGELGDPIPDETMLSRLEQLYTEHRQAALRAELSELEQQQAAEYGELCRMLGEHLPDEGKCEALRTAAKEYHTAASLIHPDDRRLLGDVQSLTAEEHLRRATALVREQAEPTDATPEASHKTARPSALVFIGLLLTVSLLIAGLLLRPLLLIGAAVGLLTALAALWQHARRRDRDLQQAQEAQQLQKERERTDTICRRLLDEANRRTHFTALWQQLAPMQDCPGATDAYWQTEQLLARISRKSTLAHATEQSRARVSSAKQQLLDIDAALQPLLSSIPMANVRADDLPARLRERCDRWGEWHTRLVRKQQELDELCAQYADDLSELNALSDQDTDLNQTRGQREALSRQREALQHTLDEQLSAMAQEEQLARRWESAAEELDTLEDERASLENLIEEQTSSYDAIVSAQKYLKQARENLSGRYLTTMKEHFAEYMRHLTGDDAPEVTMDAQFRVKLRVMGVGREVDSFSVGMRDLIGFCERLALVDAMFEGEKPFLVLDDPFTNLDDDTLARAKELLLCLSDRYQLLYLSCQSDRVPHQYQR